MRVSVEGQNNFRKNYTENIEAILSRSITKKAQVYVVPTASFNDRRLVSPVGFASDQIADVPGINAFSTGIGVSLDIRPTVALLAEAIPTLINASDLGIHRPAFSFGIQKKIWRYAFTLSLTNSPAQRFHSVRLPALRFSRIRVPIPSAAYSLDSTLVVRLIDKAGRRANRCGSKQKCLSAS